MKLSDLKEMTVLTGNVSWNNVKNTFEFLEKEGKHVGDLDGYQIYSASYKNEIFYGIKQDNEIISAINFRHASIDGKPVLEIGTAYTKEAYRQNDLPKRILFFINQQDNLSIIDYGAVSSDGVKFWKSLGRTSRFEMSWYNIKTGDKEPYDYRTDTYEPSKYRDHKMTDWRILLESHNATKHNKLFRFESEYSAICNVPYIIFPFNIETMYEKRDVA
ncbi:MAG: hypothetical protein ACREAU_00750 [Nitrosopumilaceae archaeon]